MMTRWLPLPLVLVLAAATVDSDVVRVPSEQPNIQAGIDVAQDGDTVLVAPGEYVENVLCLGKVVVLLSSAGADSTTIRAADVQEAVVLFASVTGDRAQLQGFTITGGGMSGVYCSTSTVTLRDNVIVGNSNGHGGGVCLVNTVGTLVMNNKLVANSASFGTALYMRGTSVNDTIAYNVVSGATDGRHAVSLIADVNGTSVHNNTISATEGDGIRFLGEGTLDVRNNIVFFADEYAIRTTNGPIVAEYNCTFANSSDYNFTPGNGCIFEYAQFEDSANGDYRLRYGSPCLDAGDPDSYYNDPDGTRNDMGAIPAMYPYPAAANLCTLPSGYGHQVPSATPTFYWSYVDTAATSQVLYEIEIGSDQDWTEAEMWDTGPVASVDTSAGYAGMPLADHVTYYVRTRVNNGIDWGGWTENWFITQLTTTVRVPLEQPTIQAGVDWSLPGDTVLVAEGLYTGDGNRDIRIHDKSLTVMSENGPEVTIVDCQGSESEPHRGFAVDSSDGQVVELIGLTIQNGCMPSESDEFIGPRRGGAVYCLDGTVKLNDCILSHNYAFVSGGGVFCESTDAEFLGCRFLQNESCWGGGIGVLRCPRVLAIECDFDGNEATDKGGGFYALDGTIVEVEASEFVDNRSSYGGGMHLWYNDGRVTGSSFVGNTASEWGGAIRTLLSPLVLDSCVFIENHVTSIVSVPANMACRHSTDARYCRDNRMQPSSDALPRMEPASEAPDNESALERGTLNGGALFLLGHAEIRRCLFEANTAQDEGGAIKCAGDSTRIVSCEFRDNSAVAGGAIRLTGAPTYVDSCQFIGNVATGWGGAILDDDDPGSARYCSNCLFVGNSVQNYRGSALYLVEGTPYITQSTFMFNFGGLGGVLACDQAFPVVSNSIIAFSPDGKALHCYDSLSNPQFACSDIFGNAGGDWIECIEDQADSNGNLSLDPLFCDTAGENLNIYDSSPCAPENNPCGQLIGALDVACVCCAGLRGNIDWDPDDRVNIVDLTYLIAYLFGAGPSPLCPKESNVDGDPGGSTNIVDLTYLVAFLFGGGPEPAECP